MPSATSIASRLRALVSSSQEAERLRKENAALLVEVKMLRQESDAIARMLGGSGRGPVPGRPRGAAGKPAGGAKRAGKVGKRFRTTAADVDRMTQALAKAAPGDWKTKAEICRAAGLSVEKCATAWKRTTEGYELDGRKHAAVLRSNGSRGLKGRYRKA